MANYRAIADGNWNNLAIWEDEYCTNSADSKIFIRLNNTIVELPTTMSSGGSNSYFPIGW
jgi:hypothetical protein